MTNRATRWIRAAALAAGLVTLGPAAVMAADYLAEGKQLAAKGDLRAAQIELRNAVKNDPRNGEAHLSLADVDFQLGDAAAAEKEAAKARELGTDPPRATRLLLQAYLGQDHYRELLKDFSPEGSAPDIALLIFASRALAELGLDAPDKAADEIAAGKKLAPDSVDLLLAAERVALAKDDVPAAEQAITAALAADPNSIEAMRRQAQLLLRKGDQAGALGMLDKAITAAPTNVQARLERAGILATTGQDAKAKADLDAVQAVLPGSAQAIYLRAVLLARAKDYKGANNELQKLSGVMTRMPNAYYLDAVVKDQLGQAAQAIDSAGRYAARYPDDPRGAILLARLELAARRPAAAIDALRRLASAGTKEPGIYEALGQAYATAGNLPLAAQSFETATKLAPDNAALLARLGEMHLDMGDTNSAAGDFERSLKLVPEQAGAQTMLVVTGIVSGKLDEAATHLAALRKQEGETAAVGNLTGLLKLAGFDLDGARAAFEATLQAHPDSIQAKLNLARVAALQGHSDESEKLINGVLEQQPANGAALTMLIAALQQQGKTDAVIAALTRAHAAAPTDQRLTAALADAYIRSGDAKKALALTAGETQGEPGGQPPGPTLLMARAAAQVTLGMQDDARESYRAVLATDPTSLAARLDLTRLLVVAKDSNAAKALVEDGLKAAPANGDLLQAYVAIELNAHGLDPAIAIADRLAQEPSHLPAARTLKGDLYLSQQRFDDAAKAYAEALAAAPSSGLVLRTATALAAAGHPDQGARQMRDWIAQHPDDAEVMLTLSSAEIGAHQFDAATDLLKTVLAQQPNNTVALNNLAWLYQQRGDPQARVLAQRAYLLAPGPQTADTLGYILVRQGTDAPGLSLLRQANAGLPNDPAIAYHLAVALNQAGQPEAAVKLLTPLVSGNANFPEKADAQRLLGDLSGKK